MRDGCRKRQPRVLARGPDRAHGSREGRIGEAADGNAQKLRRLLALPANRRAAVGTELVRQHGAAVGAARKGPPLALKGHDLALAPERGRAEQRARAALAGKTMAGRYELRIAGQPDLELAAAAGGFAFAGCGHRESPF